MKKFLAIFIVFVTISASILNINASTVLPEEEHNCILPSTTEPIFPPTKATRSRTVNSLPSSVDLSTDNAFPCIRAQVGNSCVAWASTYYQFGYQVAKLNNWNAKYDTTKQFSPKWTFNYVSNNANGLSYDDVYEFLSTQGAVTYSEFPTLSVEDNKYELSEWYTDTDGIREALRYRVSTANYYKFANYSEDTPITSPSSEALYSMKEYINSGHVLTFSSNNFVRIYDQLSGQYDESLNGQYVHTMIDNSTGGYGGHAMAIVGYDDNITFDINEDGLIQDYEKGAFKIANSSGTDFMNEGFVWVMYDALNKTSNADLDDEIVHYPFMDNYTYYVIEVEVYPLDLIAEVTLECASKSSVKIDLGISATSENSPTDSCITLFNRHGNKTNYSSTGKNPEEATFVFDFGNLCSYPTDWKNYYLYFTNISRVYPITVKNIKLIDKMGNVVLEDLDDKLLYNEEYLSKYLIAMVGDVDNSGTIDSNDTTLIQQYTAYITEFTDDQMTVADVTGDGSVNIFDAAYISAYIAGEINELPNGSYVYLG